MKYRATCNYRGIWKGAIVTLEPSERPGILNIVEEGTYLVLATISRKNRKLFTIFEEVLEDCEQPEEDFRLWYGNSCGCYWDEETMRDDDDIAVRGVLRQHGSLVW